MEENFETPSREWKLIYQGKKGRYLFLDLDGPYFLFGYILYYSFVKILQPK